MFVRLLVITLFTIENEFPECVKSIQEQTYRNFDHVIIQNLPKKQAHDQLYSHFFENKEKFDLLIKIDADMVIKDKYFFERIVQAFSNRQITQLVVPLHDFFTNKKIYGVVVQRRPDFLPARRDPLFTDRGRFGYLKDETIQIRDFSYGFLTHCQDPSEFQSFHYGVHRGLKCITAPKGKQVMPDNFIPLFYCTNILRDILKVKGNEIVRGHLEALVHIKQNYRRTKDIRLLYAILGYELAIHGYFKIEHLDYTSTYLKKVVFLNIKMRGIPVIKKIIYITMIKNMIRSMFLFSRTFHFINR